MAILLTLLCVFAWPAKMAQGSPSLAEGVVAALQACAEHFASGQDNSVFADWETVNDFGPTCQGCSGSFGHYHHIETGVEVQITAKNVAPNDIGTVWNCELDRKFNAARLTTLDPINAWLQKSVETGLVKPITNVASAPFGYRFMVCNPDGVGAAFQTGRLQQSMAWFQFIASSKRNPGRPDWLPEGCSS